MFINLCYSQGCRREVLSEITDYMKTGRNKCAEEVAPTISKDGAHLKKTVK